jgi:hypothetical protein
MGTRTVALGSSGRVETKGNDITPEERKVFCDSYQEAFARAVREGVGYQKAIAYAGWVATQELKFMKDEFYIH